MILIMIKLLNLILITSELENYVTNIFSTDMTSSLIMVLILNIVLIKIEFDNGITTILVLEL